MAAVFTAMVVCSFLLTVARFWCRSVAKTVRVQAGMERGDVTRRIVAAMAWRLVLLTILAFLLAGTLGGISVVTTAVAAGIFFFPILLCEVWQLARRFSFGAFQQIGARLPSERPFVALSSIAERGFLKAEYSAAGLRYLRFMPTVAESAVIGWFAIFTLPILSTAVFSQRSARSTSRVEPSMARVSSTFDLPSLARQTLPSVVLLTVFDKHGKDTGFGTGFWIEDGRWLVTNLHVIQKGFEARVAMIHGDAIPTTPPTTAVEGVVAYSEKWDLALLKVSANSRMALKLGRANGARVGEEIVVIGNPQGLEGTVSQGIISAKRHFDSTAPLLQITAPISPGSSGSPVLNARGDVVAVASAFLKLEGSQGLNFAVPAEAVSALLSEARNDQCKTLAQVAFALRGELAEDEDFKLGCASLAKDDFDSAQQYLLEASARFPDKPQVIEKLGEAMVKSAGLKAEIGRVNETRLVAFLTKRNLPNAVVDEIKRTTISKWKRWPEISRKLDDAGNQELATLLRECRNHPAESSRELAKEAVGLLQSVLALDPVSTRPRILLATAHDLAGESEQAAEVWRNLAAIYLARNSISAALAANQDELLARLRSIGFPSSSTEEMRRRGIDSFDVVWWNDVCGRLSVEQRYRFEVALTERKSLQRKTTSR